MNLKSATLIAAFAAALCTGAPYAVASPQYSTLSITRAAYANDVEQLQTLVQTSEGYNRAYALYRIAQLGFTEPGAHLKPMLEQAAAILQQADDAESKVLLAAVYNLSMGLEPGRAKHLSAEVEQLLETAKASPSARARALLIEGVNRFHTPAAYGGGVDMALALLEEAAALFAQRADGKNLSPIAWGEAETQIWLGQVRARLGQPQQARAHYEQALSLDPSCAWANYYLGQL